jgi:BolA protein
MEHQLRKMLTDALSPAYLEIINESSLHRGHAGDDGSGHTHYRLRISAHSLAGRSRVDQHRLINTAVAPLFEQGLHALAIEVLSTDSSDLT